MLKFGIVMDNLLQAGMHPTIARNFKLQASALLAQVASANNALFGKEPYSAVV